MEGKDILSWQVELYKESWLKTFCVILFLLSVIVIVQVSFREGVLTAISIVVLAGSLLRFFLITRYELSPQGITVGYMGMEKKHSWEKFQCYYSCPQGVQLSTLVKPSRLDSFRGLYIIYGKQNREEVLKYLGTYLNEAK